MADREQRADAGELRGRAAKVVDLIAYQDGCVVSRQIVNSPTGSVTLFAFDAGQDLSEHTTPYDALLQVLDGKALITIEGKRHDLSAGDMIVLPANRPHAVYASTRFKMLLTMIRS
jgi:quercetin dioxygenase-like cupin family protein